MHAHPRIHKYSPENQSTHHTLNHLEIRCKHQVLDSQLQSVSGVTRQRPSTWGLAGSGHQVSRWRCFCLLILASHTMGDKRWGRGNTMWTTETLNVNRVCTSDTNGYCWLLTAAYMVSLMQWHDTPQILPPSHTHSVCERFFVCVCVYLVYVSVSLFLSLSTQHLSRYIYIHFLSILYFSIWLSLSLYHYVPNYAFLSFSSLFRQFWPTVSKKLWQQQLLYVFKP